jgi:uncharacterized membrane protein
MNDVVATAPPSWKPLALLFTAAGILHFAVPRRFEAIVPRRLPAALPDARALVRISGAAELVCAAGLAVPATRRFAGPASAALLLAVYPANLDQAARAVRSRRASGWTRAVLLARVPLQIPMILRALRLGGRA